MDTGAPEGVLLFIGGELPPDPDDAIGASDPAATKALTVTADSAEGGESILRLIT